LERFRGSQKEDERDPLSVQSSLVNFFTPKTTFENIVNFLLGKKCPLSIVCGGKDLVRVQQVSPVATQSAMRCSQLIIAPSSVSAFHPSPLDKGYSREGNSRAGE